MAGLAVVRCFRVRKGQKHPLGLIQHLPKSSGTKQEVSILSWSISLQRFPNQCAASYQQKRTPHPVTYQPVHQ